MVTFVADSWPDKLSKITEIWQRKNLVGGAESWFSESAFHSVHECYHLDIYQIHDVKRVEQALGVAALRRSEMKGKVIKSAIFLPTFNKYEYKTISSMINDVINGPFDYDVSYL